MKAKITDIKRFAVHDGDGIRTTVFFKGCPLKCVWCHNPETISQKTELAFYEHKCTLCTSCEKLCECSSFSDGVHTVDRQKCKLCGKCAEICPSDAFEIIGKEMSVDEILNIVLKDRSFYQSSGGGVTLSGGECLCQADFCGNLLMRLKTENINTAVDTCGFASRESIDKVIDYTDKFLYDIKAYDEDVHIKCTGMGNKIILENLEYISARGKPIEIRIPYVPDFNDNQIDKIGKYLSGISSITKVKILPYHNLARSKYLSVGLENTLPVRLPKNNEISAVKEKILSFGLKCE